MYYHSRYHIMIKYDNKILILLLTPKIQPYTQYLQAFSPVKCYKILVHSSPFPALKQGRIVLVSMRKINQRLSDS